MTAVVKRHDNGMEAGTQKIMKRDGRTETFDARKIVSAVRRCLIRSLHWPEADAEAVSQDISRKVENILTRRHEWPVGVEDVQRLVLQQLWAAEHFEAAEQYTIYREEHRKVREARPISPTFAAAVAQDSKHFPTDLQYYQYISKFSRWQEGEQRRETWRESCNRVMGWFKKLPKVKLTEQEWAELDTSLYDLETCCAMRVLQMAGPALDRCNVGAYNCSYHPLQDQFAFVELLYILMQGTGSGFSVEEEYVGRLPRVRKQRKKARPDRFVIEDSTEGWCDAYKFGLERWWDGYDVDFDDSGVRPAGARLLTKGGRASGPAPLRELLRFSRQTILSRQGGVLTDLDCHNMACVSGKIVQVGGVRRASSISISDLASMPMRNAKTGTWWQTSPWLTMANNSAAYDGTPDDVTFMEEWLSLAKSGSGERGIFNRAAVEKSIPKRRKKIWYFGMNPCLVGDTLVAVADGRGAVSIRQLAEEGKDVPVYCVDDANVPTIRWMRHPRLTAVQEPILKVELDNGRSVRVTRRHKFRLRDGSYVAAEDLRPGDRLAVLTGYEPVSCQGESYADRYNSWCYQNNFRNYPHRMMAEFYAGREVLPGEHVHHKDEHPLHDTPGNLEILPAVSHLSGHSQGEGNPTFCGLDNEKLIEIGRKLTRSLGRRFSTAEWSEFATTHSLPRSFSAWRKKTLGTISAFARRCAVLEGLEDYGGADPRVIRTYQQLVAAGLDAEIVDGQVLVHKQCENCGGDFTVHHRHREQAHCSYTCANRLKDRAKAKESQKLTLTRRKQQRRDQQLAVYQRLQQDLGRDPWKKEWVEACKLAGVSTEISRPSSPFSSWDELTSTAAAGNHKVVAVTADGYEDVYNGTVDDFHNFFVGGWDEGITEHGRRKVCWINNLQCGEILLRPYQFCNLSIVVARPHDTRESLKRKVRIAAYWGCMQKTCTAFKYIRDDWKKNCEEEALLGVDITGHADCPLLRRGAPGRAELLRELREVVAQVDTELSERWGVNRSAADTCVKPSGDSAVFFDCGSGISPRFSQFQIRWVREPVNSPVAQFLISEGVPYAVAPEDPSLLVFGFPKSAPAGATLRNDMTAVQQLENWLEWKENWAEHSVACTIYVEPHEWLEVGNWCRQRFDRLTGLSFLPKDNGVYTYAPNEELTKEQYDEWVSRFPKINWAKLCRFETEDCTTSAREYACQGDKCGLV